MRPFYLFPVFLLFFTIHAIGQNTWTVDNNPGSTADFTSLIAAIDSASAGDAILVQGSNTSYGSINLSKSLKIYGTGYFLSENPNTQSNNTSASIGLLTLSTGSANSIIRGFMITNELRINESNITVQNCHVVHPGTYNSSIGIDISGNPTPSNIIISGCYLPDDAIDVNSSTNVVLYNNYVGLYITGANQTTIINNVVKSNIYASNSLVQNNIVYSGPIPGNSNNTVENNIASGTGTTDNGNQPNVDMSTVFEGYPTPGSFSSDGRWQLKSGSPAMGAGVNGEDCGMFGGPNPYILSGIPMGIPHIYELDVPFQSSGNTMQVTVKAKSN